MKIISSLKFLLISTAFFCASAMAQTGVSDTTLAPSKTTFAPSLFGIVVKLVISLAVIIGLIYLSTYFMKKLNSRVAGGGNMNDAIRIMGRTFLSPKQSLYIVKIGQKYNVIGVCENSISKITELSEEEAVKMEGRTAMTDQSGMRGKFSEIFKGIIKR